MFGGHFSGRGIAAGAVVLVHVGFVWVLLLATHIIPPPEHMPALVMAQILKSEETKQPDQAPQLAHMMTAQQVMAEAPQFQIARSAPMAAAVPHPASAHAITIGAPKPISVSCAVPHYPPDAKELGETGAVTIALLISTQGKVLKTSVRQSSGYSSLDTAAESALAQCDFLPGRKGGQPVETWTTLRYVWSLD